MNRKDLREAVASLPGVTVGIERDLGYKRFGDDEKMYYKMPPASITIENHGGDLISRAAVIALLAPTSRADRNAVPAATGQRRVPDSGSDPEATPAPLTRKPAGRGATSPG